MFKKFPIFIWQELLSCVLLFVGFNSITFKGYIWWSICTSVIFESRHSKQMLEGFSPFTWIGQFSIFIAWKPSQTLSRWGFRHLDCRQEARRRQNEERDAVFFWRVPSKNSRNMSRSFTEGPPGTLLPRLPTWMGWLYGTQLSTDLNPTSICVYLLINTFMCYFGRFNGFIFCCVSKILTSLNSQGMPSLTYARSKILEQQGFLRRKSVSWWRPLSKSIANW